MMNKLSMRKKHLYSSLKLAVIIFVPVALLILPMDFFDHGSSLCLSKMLFNVECYGCGLTRALMHLIHLDFEQAFVYNMLSFFVLPLLMLLWLQWFLIEFKNIKGAVRSIAAQ